MVDSPVPSSTQLSLRFNVEKFVPTTLMVASISSCDSIIVKERCVDVDYANGLQTMQL
jgi:hypothetical protein